MPHSEAYLFLSTYWWLMFPLGWGALALVQTFLRHRRAARALELIASYAERGPNRRPSCWNACARPSR